MILWPKRRQASNMTKYLWTKYNIEYGMTLVIYGGIMELCEPKWIHAIKSGVWGGWEERNIRNWIEWTKTKSIRNQVDSSNHCGIELKVVHILTIIATWMSFAFSTTKEEKKLSINGANLVPFTRYAYIFLHFFLSFRQSWYHALKRATAFDSLRVMCWI